MLQWLDKYAVMKPRRSLAGGIRLAKTLRCAEEKVEGSPYGTIPMQCDAQNIAQSFSVAGLLVEMCIRTMA